MKKIIAEVMLYEGLEITHAIDTSILNLERMWVFDGRVSYAEASDTIKMTIWKRLDKKEFDSVMNHIENFLGYFPSHISVPGNNVKFDYNKAIELANVGKPFAVYFDAKYDPEISESKLPPTMYHVTPMVYETKILKIGLVPKRKNKLSSHPERIYMASSQNDAVDLLGSSVFTKDMSEFTLLSIDLKSLRKSRKIRIFNDPVYAGKGFYTYENIPPQYLKVEKRIKV